LPGCRAGCCHRSAACGLSGREIILYNRDTPRLGTSLQVLSFTVADGPFVLHDAIPLSRAAVLEYISLCPSTSPFAADKVKKGEPSLAVLRWYLSSVGEFLRTDSMPPSAPDLAAYRSLVRIGCPFAAFKLNIYCSPLRFKS